MFQVVVDDDDDDDDDNEHDDNEQISTVHQEMDYIILYICI